MANNVPNLDCMPHDELMSFWKTYTRSSRKAAAWLIGDTRPGYTTLAATLANYACNKAVAMACRLKGDITAAVFYEHACDLCYARIPEDLRW